MTADLTIWAAFLAGILSFVSPCVLPLVPPYLGFLAGATIEDLQGTDAGGSAARRRAVFVAVFFVLGFSTVFVSLGATASVVGQLLARHAGELALVAGIVIIIMGLHFLGLFRIGLLYREARFNTASIKAGPLGAYLMGLAFAFGWTPCIGPILGVILTIAGSRETVGEGAFMLAVYSAGLGVPFIASALFAGAFLSFLRRFRSRLGMVEKAMGLVLVVTGVLFVTGDMQQISFWLLETFPQLQTLG
ncbi:Thiol:disulfide interchange protein DsbD precursor [Hartmannibacter diazotrophicus]|uniref:Thiol:disulfide interchange protein DsbD n=1 Tax=Hartmannibacter diazotrophicus TaxID=1482074 RepID=A0A2C9D762_9HYPH|nr:cytochrome c biogenesis protein CcdA [Hartmannibacter diazotrophicus]SON56030.1 Thiol:disulfide interchange protein DsbD precursor [Hartmannibacter diazotrophicus]